MARRFKTLVQFDSGLIIPANAGIDKVLTSDASGNATWAAATGGGGSGSVPIEAWKEFGIGANPTIMASTPAGDYPTAAFRKTPDGRVELRGYVNTVASLITTLPDGYRPTNSVSFPMIAWSGTAWVTCRIVVGADGTVKGYTSADVLGTFNGVALNEIEFPTSQDTFPTGPSGPGAEIQSAEIDFGSTPVYEKVFTITDAAVTVGMQVNVMQSYEGATGRDADEQEMELFSLMARSQSGSILLYARSLEGRVEGLYTINYVAG